MALSLNVKQERIPVFKLLLERGRCYRELTMFEESVVDLKKCSEFPRVNKLVQIGVAYNELGILYYR